MQHRTPRTLILAAIALLGWTPAAMAYIDPTAAGAALQSLYVILASALAFVVLLPQKVAGFFTMVKARLFGGSKGPSAAPGAEQE